jgi:hypothetical protein
MKCLRINEGKGEFSLDGASFRPLDEIRKDDILTLLDITLNTKQEIEMDEYSADAFKNPAHKVIYSNLHDKFLELKASKGQFTSDINELYQEAYDKYKHEEPDDSSDCSSVSQ